MHYAVSILVLAVVITVWGYFYSRWRKAGGGCGCCSALDRAGSGCCTDQTGREPQPETEKKDPSAT